VYSRLFNNPPRSSKEWKLEYNARTSAERSNKREKLDFNELGLNMTTVINMFLRTVVREYGIPFELKLDVPQETAAEAFREQEIVV
jgi:DNA-damage-inducible protein J